MARGIDTAAHEGALAGGGRTVAVTGCGLGLVYPRENAWLFDRIVQSGGALSEFPVLAPPEAHHFPARNRIISGMCQATVVVEAGLKSGALITAKLALDQGRDVFAVPGPARSPQSAGAHGLIRQGAGLVESAEDILEQLSPCWRPPLGAGAPERGGGAPPDLSPEEASLYAELASYPTHIDVLVERLKLAPGKTAGVLLELEIKGLAKQLPGKYFTRGEQ
jgi:DNA processing protein